MTDENKFKQSLARTAAFAREACGCERCAPTHENVPRKTCLAAALVVSMSIHGVADNIEHYSS